jgi:hypothetical protein
VRRAAVLVVLAAAVAWPAVDPSPSDGFPVSSYPMFASDRGRIVDVATAVGLDDRGAALRLDPHAIGGGDEVMLAASAVRRAVAAGGAEAARFCAEVAGRVDDPHVVAVELRTERHDAVADPTADRPPVAVTVHARCEVPA